MAVYRFFRSVGSLPIAKLPLLIIELGGNFGQRGAFEPQPVVTPRSCFGDIYGVRLISFPVAAMRIFVTRRKLRRP